MSNGEKAVLWFLISAIAAMFTVIVSLVLLVSQPGSDSGLFRGPGGVECYQYAPGYVRCI